MKAAARAWVLLSLLSVVALAPGRAQALTIVTLSPDETSVSSGATFEIDLVASFGATSVAGFGLDLVFDTSVLAVSGAPLIGPAWDPAFAPDGDGLVGIAPIAGVTGDGVLLATVTFLALGSGTTSISVAATAGDFTEGFPLLSPPGSFDPFESGAALVTVPEPRLVWLLIGLLAVLVPRRRMRLPVVAAALLMASGTTARAQTAEVEPNDTFATRQVLPAGETVVTGSLPGLFDDADVAQSRSLTAGQVDEITLTGLPPGSKFIAWATWPSGGIFRLYLRSVNPDGTQEAVDYDTPTSSIRRVDIQGTVRADGSVVLQTTGYDDLFFNGSHVQNGPYDLFVRAPIGDVDFFRFNGLTPGASYRASTNVSGVFRLGRFSETGALLEETVETAFLDGVVPASGAVDFALTGIDDAGYDGSEFRAWPSYTLTVNVEEPPEPPPPPPALSSCDTDSTLTTLPTSVTVPWGAAMNRRTGEVVVTGWAKDLRPFSWTPDGGVVFLDAYHNSGRAYARAVSYGEVPVYVGASQGPDGRAEAVRWIGFGSTGLGFVPGKAHSLARAVTPDGSTVVGWGSDVSSLGPCISSCAGHPSHNDLVRTGDQAFVWTAAGGLQVIAPIGGSTTYSHAVAVSDDGQTVVGEVRIADRSTIFFQRPGGLEIVEPPAGFHLYPADASADGKTVVGVTEAINGTFSFGFFYEAETGEYQVFTDPREGAGLDVPLQVTSVSSDGGVAAGSFVDAESLTPFVAYPGGSVELLSELLREYDDSWAQPPNWQSLVVERNFSRLLLSGNIVFGANTGAVMTGSCRDRDDDGLCDFWETAGGIDLDRDGEISPCTESSCPDLELAGADPSRKDIYVEVDNLLAAFGPSLQDAALARIEQAFAVVPAPLSTDEPGLSAGYNLHLQRDERDLLLPSGSTDWTEPQPCPEPSQFPGEFEAFQSAHFGSLAQRDNDELMAWKRKLYRYLVFGGKTDCYIGTAGVGSRQVFLEDEEFVGLQGEPLIRAQAGALMHEIGHTFGLQHDGGLGGEEQNRKPNVHSVMNYIWTIPWTERNPTPGPEEITFNLSWILDFSRVEFETLYEAALDEEVGIGGHYLHFLPIGPPPLGHVTEWGPANYDQDLTIDSETVSRDLNRTKTDQNPTPGQLLWAAAPGEDPADPGIPEWAVLRDNVCDSLTDSWAGTYGTFVFATLGDEGDEFVDLPPMDCDLNGIGDGEDLALGNDTDLNGNGLLDGCEPLAGDLDGDGDVDEDDREALLASFGYHEGEAEYLWRSDLDGDRATTFVDYQLWLQSHDEWQAGLPAAPAAVSGPACGLGGVELVLALGLLGAARRARTNRGELDRIPRL